MKQNGLIVMGAGPKGVALWAKHWAIKKTDVEIAPITILERRKLGSHWIGDDGYSDGFQLLITPSEQDLGYPYPLSHQDRNISLSIREWMLKLSWMKYLISKHKYPQWVLDEKPRSTHQELVDYLRWASRESGMSITHVEITRISIEDSGWSIIGNSTQGEVKYRSDGLVITGPGEARRIQIQPTGDKRLFDGRSFWKNLDSFNGLNLKRVAIIGAGETAAAIACSVLDRIKDPDSCSVDLICKQNAYFSRAQAQKDLRYFSDPTNWPRLSPSRRNSIVRRADRGVVSVHIKDRLENSSVVSYIHADVEKIEARDASLFLHLVYEDGLKEELPYDFVVVATGFNPLTFIGLFDLTARCHLYKHLYHLMPESDQAMISTKLGISSDTPHFYNSLDEKIDQKAISRAFENIIVQSIGEDLSLEGFTPKLHLPMMAGFAQGPGFPNLNCLGLLSDRILKSYLNSRE